MRSLSRCIALFVLALTAEAAAASPGEVLPPQMVAASPISLIESLPSPTPRPILPSMPPQQAGAFVFYDDFERESKTWQPVGEPTGVAWRRLKASTCGGLYTMLLGQPANKPFMRAKTVSYLTTAKPIDLRKARRPQLQYDIKGAANPPETLRLTAQVRRLGGAWQDVGPSAIARYTLVVTFVADLKPFAGQQIELRFRGEAHGAEAPNKGLFLDDIHIIEPRQ